MNDSHSPYLLATLSKMAPAYLPPPLLAQHTVDLFSFLFLLKGVSVGGARSPWGSCRRWWVGGERGPSKVP